MTVYRLPIRLPAKSARSSPSLKGRVCAPGTFQQLVESLVSLTHKQSVCTGYHPATPISFFLSEVRLPLSIIFMFKRFSFLSQHSPIFTLRRGFLLLFFFFLQRYVRQESNSRLTFVTVYRLPIRLPAKSALTRPVVYIYYYIWNVWTIHENLAKLENRTGAILCR